MKHFNTYRHLASARRCAFALVIALSIAVFSLPALAGAAEKAPLIETGVLRVVVYPGVDAKTTAVLAQYEAPESTTLPARVRIPLPETAHVGWAGEINPEVGLDNELPYTIGSNKSGSYVELTLKESKTAQVDYSHLPLTIKGSEMSAKVTWAQSVNAERTEFEVRLPASVHSVKINPEPVGGADKNDYGETQYSLPTKQLSLGDIETIDVSYKTGAGVGPVSYTSALVIAAIVLTVIAFVLITLAFKRKPATEE